MTNTTPKRLPADVAAMARHYLDRSSGDALRALHEAIQDGLEVREDAQQREAHLRSAVSHGFVRAGSKRPQ